MSNFKFEGNIDGVSARQLEYIGGVLKERGYQNEKVLVQAVGEVGDNYGSNIQRIIVEKDNKPFKMIAKVASSDETLRVAQQTMPVYRNEHIMYSEVLPTFLELQKSAGVPENDRLRFAACYGSHSEPPDEIILLEDLQLSGFVLLDRFKSLTDEGVKSVIKSFANLHSCSYALRKSNPELFATFKNSLTNMWEYMQKMPNSYFEKLENEIFGIVEAKYKNWFKGAIVNSMNNLETLDEVDKDSPYSIIQQGDNWINNFMFKLKDGKPVECCIIDYQIPRESSPVADIFLMIFNCTDYDTRAKHYYEWIDFYHSELDKCLRYYELNSEDVYPRSQLNADLKRYAKIAFGITCFVSSVVLRESADASKLKDAMSKEGIEGMMKNTTVSHLDEKFMLRFKAKLEGNVKSFLELGYL